MHVYEERLSFLLNQGVIHESTCIKARNVLNDINIRYELNEDKIAFIMHLIMCIERVHKHEQLQDEQMQKIEELRGCEQFDKGMEELLRIQEVGEIRFNECEVMYLLIHLMNLQK